MSAGTFHIKIEQGADFALTIIVKDSTGAVRNLTGYTAKMDVRETVEATTPIVTLSSEGASPKIIITPLLGKLALALNATATGAFTFTRAVYDLEITSGAGVVERILQGDVFLSKEVTRST